MIGQFLTLSFVVLNAFASQDSKNQENFGNHLNSSLVATKYGLIRGFKYTTNTGVKSDIFLNIPYAKPPVGELRFEKPVSPNRWSGIRDGTKWPLGCAPSSLGGDINTNSEDCLYINVFRPNDRKVRRPRKGYPVLVWIHGGSNVVGSTKQFGYINLTDNFIPQGIIVVTVQYRLGPFGFSTTGDNVMPGNLGLWDMIQSAKFLREVAGQFGGNPKRIVLWGLSSSAKDVSALAFTPHASPYFDASILQSGTSYSATAANNEGIEATYKVAKALNCSTANSTDIKACFKSKTIQDFFNALNIVGLTRINPLSINVNLFQPRIDGDLFPKNVSEGIKLASPKPAYIGFGDAEAAAYTIFGNLLSPFAPFKLTRDNWATFGEQNFTRFIQNSVIDAAFYGALAIQAQQDVINFYTSDKPQNATYVYWVQKYTQLISDYLFYIPALLEVRDRVANNWPTYLYQNVHYSRSLYDQISLNPPLRGSFHANEYPYQFGNYFFTTATFPFDAADLAFRKNLADTIGNFVKNNNPSTPTLNWQKATQQHPFHYAKINASATFEQGPIYSDRFQFWDEMINGGRYPFDLIFRVNFNNITTYACNIATNQVC